MPKNPFYWTVTGWNIVGTLFLFVSFFVSGLVLFVEKSYSAALIVLFLGLTNTFICFGVTTIIDLINKKDEKQE